MRLDDALKLGAAQAIVDTDAYLTNRILDFGDTTPRSDPGAGEPMCIVFCVDIAAAGSTDTSDLIAVNSENDNLAAHSEVGKRRIANALLTAGSIHIVPVPPGAITKQFFGGRVELGSGDTITVSAWYAPLSAVQQYDRYYVSGIPIS